VSALLGVLAIVLTVDAVMSRVTAPVARRPGPTPAPATPARHRRSWRRVVHRRRPPPGPGDVAAWCDDVARRVRAGDALAAAVRDASGTGPMNVVAESIRRRLERGMPVDGAVAAVDDAGPAATLALEVVGVVATIGGSAAEPIERVAATLRQRVADLHERRAQTAQARLSATVMSILPVAALAVSVSVSAPVRSAVGSPPGLAAIGLGIALNGAGWCWMRRMIGSNK
jgi:tight adherence protein B